MLPGLTKYCTRSLASLISIAACLLSFSRALAIEEPYLNELKGTHVAAGSSFTVADEKFNSPAAWGLIQQHVAVNDIVTFEINFDTSIYFYNKPFDCTLNFKIYIYGNQSDTSEITDSVTHANISLQVRFDTTAGKAYKGVAMYKFANVHKYKVKILSITSPQLSPIPAIFRLKGQIIVERQYTFQDNSTDVTRHSTVNGNQLKLEWTPSNYPGAESFDLEYTHIDGGSAIAASIRSYKTGSDYFVPADSLNKWFTNNSTRITTAAASYLANIPYDSGFMLFRIRGVQIHYPDGVRWEGNWNYLAREASGSCSSCPSGVVFFNPHESNLNWQYSISFAEEGKRKEIISYFDGTLRSRQSVTIGNSDNKTIVQETIYDALGRAALNILPAPTNDSTIHYFRGFNKNGDGMPYSFSDLLYGNCATTADSVSEQSGAGRYYSSNNEFLNSYYYAKYIPAAQGYPFIVTEFMGDNTGRLRAQGGVGTAFQLNTGHETRYFYGKPSQKELDRLFGTEAGNASHYLKNMVVDPNGQISVSYLNASGKPIATALAGAVPTNHHALPSSVGASTQITDDLMKPEDFSRNASDYSISASTTFLAPVTGTYILNYRVDPLRMEKLYGPQKDSVICNNCYYDLEITVKDDCNNIIRQETRAAGTVFDTACTNPPGAIADTIGVDIPKIGEYYVVYRLVISGDALNFYDSTHLVKNSDIKKLNFFLLEELKNTDFYGCYNTCETCFDALGTKDVFTQQFKSFYTADSLLFSVEDSLYVASLYDSLYAHCASIQGQCGANICDEKLQMLKMDVSPGGQYALYDSLTYELLEPEINVLGMRYQIEQFTDINGNPDSVLLYTVDGADSVRIAVKELSDSLFIANWKDEWADSLVKLHPEYCHYLWCIANSGSYEFDNEIQTWISADSVMNKGWFYPGVYDTIMAHDPFFLPGGNGYVLRDKMRDSLRLFSRTFARLSLSDKNILQFIDVTLYCKTQSNGWEGCNPDSACRSRNREWFLYQQLYLNLKHQFYEEARRTSEDPTFSSCVNCHIGKDPVTTITCVPPAKDSFDVFEYRYGGIDSVVIKYRNGQAVVGSKVTVLLRLNCSQERRAHGGPSDQDIWLDIEPAPVVFQPGDSVKTIFIVDPTISNPNASCNVAVYDVLCGDQLTPFQDSSCNYHCPGGVYDPYDRDNLSFYIEYGSAIGGPVNTPEGYGNCRFYNVFDLKTGANTSCKFFSVWVCVYDSTCGGICNVPEYPSTCPDQPYAELYQNKVRRYPEYVNTSDFIDGVLSGNPQQSSALQEQQAIAECRSNCEAQADIWINQLGRCTTNAATLDQLKQALIDICSAGCSLDRPFGASTIPASISATYHSFEEAIIGILGPGAINDSCAAELLANPYPYDKQPAYAERMITETNYEICQKIGQYKTAWQSSGFDGSFHTYLVKTIGSGYQLDSLELDDLLNSCTNCNGLLKDDIVLPIVFEPNAPPCLLCDSVQTAFTAFNNKFSGISTTDDDYTILVANFFNHRFGYSLTYDQYRTYLDSCTASPLYTGKLCNQPVAVDGEIENNGNGCMADLFATALTNANNTYIAYIDSVRRDFREAYMTRCMNVQPVLTMKAELFEYHYSLHYYDQSGALVKTIPPEGVVLLDSAQLELVKLHRLLQSEGCYQYSDSIRFNNNGQITWALTDSFEYRPWTAEMMTNLTAYADQVLVSKLSEYTYDTTGGVSFFYRHTGFLVKLENNKLAVEVYGIGADTVQKSAHAVSVLNASAILPLNSWRHVVVERTANPFAPVQLWVNGNPVALQYTLNELDSAVILAGTASLITGSHNAPHFATPAGLQGTIKNLRIYNRLLLPGEIRQITYNNCQLPVNQNGLLFWSAMNDATNNLVRDLITRQNGVLTGFTWEPFAGVFPKHRLPTTYQFNSLGQALQQFTPDGDTTQLWFDRLGRLIATQNKEQKANASYSGTANRFSYTKYDALSRIIEVGEKSNPSTDIRNVDLLDTTATQSWMASGVNRQVTKTIHDRPVNPIQSSATSRKRAVASVYLENATDPEGDSTLYSYDILGNVKTMVHHVKALIVVDATNGKKRIDYDYDLVSGKVNKVSYQEGKGDQFFYKYQYDADNRVIRSYSSRDKLVWNEDASYSYYLHGPLARTELGQLKVQGVDYINTLQGWLKGINSDSLNPAKEVAGDGQSNSMFSRVSRDVFGLKLGYYNNDYIPIGGNAAGAFNQLVYTAPVSLEPTGNQLFNGNISHTTLALSKVNNGATAGYSYGYDQLGRLTEMRQHTTSANWSNSNIINAYRESIAYDANGNILKYLRQGANVNGLPLDMDSLGYKYNRDVNGNIVNNRLNFIRDQVNAVNYAVDVDNQASNNYLYDKTGNLVKDVAEGLDTVRWTAYGKVNHIEKNTGLSINYGYDAVGNRTLKMVINQDTTINTYYIRDAQGNVLAIYTYSSIVGSLKWSEQHLYGSTRLGIWMPDTTIPVSPPVVIGNTPVYDSLVYGSRVYELTNHLSNVLATISDKKIGHDSSGVVNYFLADVLSQNDYYPGGMMMTGRTHSTKINYRYSINGQEKEKELNENITSAEFWMYDSRIVRRWNLDPKPGSNISGYAVFANNPVLFSDPGGDTARVELGENGLPTGRLGQRFSFINDGTLSEEQFEQMKQTFLGNLQQQINDANRTYCNGAADVGISLNTNDPLASVIEVTFGADGTSNASMEKSTIFISLSDVQSTPNAPTHEWLHTAGLMDRYYEEWGYNMGTGANAGIISLNEQRSGTIPMERVPKGYDDAYVSAQNMMSVAGSQITQKQWSIVFSGVSEKSLGGLGAVSILLPNKGPYSLSTGYRKKVSENLKTMAFSSSQAFVIRNSGGTALQVPFPMGVNRERTHFVIHGLNGNIFPPAGVLRGIADVEREGTYPNRTIISEGIQR